jgi:hypothetical protein
MTPANSAKPNPRANEVMFLTLAVQGIRQAALDLQSAGWESQALLAMAKSYEEHLQLIERQERKANALRD